MTDKDVFELFVMVLLTPCAIGFAYWLFNGGRW